MSTESAVKPRPAAAPQQGQRGNEATPARPAMSAPVWGLVGAMALLLLYVGIVGGASRSFGHVRDLLATDWPFVVALAAGFGIQVGLYVHLRHLSQAARTVAGATAGVGTGTSTVAMIACCAHHATDIVPLLGLPAVAGAAGVLTEWRVPLMSLGIATNLIGIALNLWLVRQARRRQHRSSVGAGAVCH